MAENDNNIKFFDKEKLDEMISHYLNDIDSFWKDEEYKWQAVQHFQNHWNIDSDDFEGMLKESTSKHLNLLGSGNYFPIGVLLETAKEFHEESRELFKRLYDEDSDIIQRIKDFQKGIDDIYKKTTKAGKSTYQDLRAISALLWLRYPDKYYIYKKRELNKTFQLLGGNTPKFNGKAECFPMFLDYMNALNDYFLSNETFKRKISSHINSNSLYEDEALHTATIDFVFYTGKRFDPNRLKITKTEDMSKETDMSVNNRILERNKIKEEFKLYLEKAARSGSKKEGGNNLINLGSTAVSSYLLFIEVEKLFDYNPEKWNHIESLYDIIDSSTIKDIATNLLKDEEFKKRDKKNNSNYRSNAIKHYYCFVNARELFLQKNTGTKVHVPANLPNQVIYYGAPGTGKSYGINKNPNINDTNSFRTTFHPDSDYSSFVGCFKPTMKDVKHSNTSEVQCDNNLKDEVDYCEDIVYEFVPQVFTDAYVAAWSDLKNPYYLIIEELNRGNCAQIFGDLFQLLDRVNGVSKYTIKADRDLCRYLEKKLGIEHDGIKKGKLKLPANLNILATMNTSDQSLFPIDSAFKRRWDWIYIPICYEKTFTDIYGKKQVNRSYNFEIRIGGDINNHHGGKKYRWIEFLKKVNDKIYLLTESEDKKMGNYFVDLPEDETVIDEIVFKNKVMFYLWNDVCKDEKGNPNNFYKTVDKEFSFNELFENNASKLLDGFMDELDVTGEEIKEPDEMRTKKSDEQTLETENDNNEAKE